MESDGAPEAARWPRHRWVTSPAMPPAYAAQLPHLHPLVSQVLYTRGIAAAEADAFLRADRSLSHAPLLFHGMARAVERITASIAAGERIGVFGDVDVDGITSTALLVEVLRALGADVIPFIPNRNRDGYGLTRGGVEALHGLGVGLIVTVDCGSSSIGGVRAAATLGMNVIVTDHHLVPHTLPHAIAVINPQQPLCTYPFKGLAGVGIAFKLAQALLEGRPREARTPLVRRALDLVAIGTIADMAPLVGENRLLVKMGLRQLNDAMRVGVQALVAASGLKRGVLSAFDVGYRLAPRLNAAGRIDDASIGYRLMLTEDYGEADDLVRQLEAKNVERQRRTQEVLAAARLKVAGAAGDRVLVVGERGWPGGVLGLVAGRLTDEFGRPAFVFGQTSAAYRGRGSARGVAGFNVMEALDACRDLLAQYGGHAQAAGFAVKRHKLGAFRERLQEWASQKALEPAATGPSVLTIDAEPTIADLSLDLHEQLAELEPHGAGLAAPLFLVRHLRLLDYRVVGNNHLRLTVGTPRRPLTAIAFGWGDVAPQLARDHLLDIVFHLDVNEWNGERTLQLRVRDLARSSDH